MEVTVRRSVEADQIDVSEMSGPPKDMRKTLFGRASSGSLIETSVLALTATLGDTVVAFASFDSKPPGDLGSDLNCNAKLGKCYDLPVSASWIYLTSFAFAANEETLPSHVLLQHLLHTAASTLVTRQRILLLVPTSLDVSNESTLTSVFTRIKMKDKLEPKEKREMNSYKLYQIACEELLPNVHIRGACIEDHDDLEPILTAQGDSLVQRFGDYFLADLIREQNETNVCLVAEGAPKTSAAPARAVGLAALSSDVDVHPLLTNFELSAYNNLTKSTLRTMNAGKVTPLRIVISGPPASGKGTQCDFLVAKFGIVHLSTGDMLRSAIQRGDEHGLKAKTYMDSGNLVPDELIVDVILSRLKEPDCEEKGWLLDGFPRTATQADTMAEKGIFPDAVVVLKVPDDDVVKRISGRRLDPTTGKTYHVTFNPPPQDDSELLSRLVQRDDDNENTVRTRLAKYHENEDGVVSTLQKRSTLVSVQGTEDKNTIAQSVIANVEAIKQGQEFQVLVQRGKLSPPKLVITGPPAGGKGTQCELLVERFGVVHLSTGDMLRASIEAGAELGTQAKDFMDKGELVPDDLIISLILERLKQPDCSERGWLLDGFPRTAAQAEAMVQSNIIPDSVLVLEVPDEEVVRRISGRRVDLSTGKTYHLEFNPPPPEIAHRVVQRSDDTEETLVNRLAKFHENSGAVINVFEARNGVAVIRCDGMVGKTEIGRTFLAPTMEKLYEYQRSYKGQTAEEIQLHEASMNCFALTLFCISPQYEFGAIDLISNAFTVFPQREYCLVTLPTTCEEPHFLNFFTLVHIKPDAVVAHMLYIVHRNAISYLGALRSSHLALPPIHLSLDRYRPSLELSKARLLLDAKDSSIVPLLQHLEAGTQSQILQDLGVASGDNELDLEDHPRHLAFKIHANNVLVGLVLVSRDGEFTNGLKHFFDLESFMLMMYHRSKDQGILKHFILNPIFSVCKRSVLEEVLRFTAKTCLFHLLPVSTNRLIPPFISSVVEDMTLVAPRRRIKVSAEELRQYPKDAEKIEMANKYRGYALFALSKKLLSEPKIVVNYRIVVVGASDTAIACLSRLVSVPYLRFSNVTLISPSDIKYNESDGGQEETSSLRASTLTRKSLLEADEYIPYLLPAAVRFIKSKVVRIHRQEKVVELRDGSSRPYDYLLLTTGLRDGLFNSPEFTRDTSNPDTSLKSIPKQVEMLSNVEIADKVHERIRNGVEKGDADTIAVFGDTVQALQVVQTLLQSQVDGSKILLLLNSSYLPLENEVIRNEVNELLAASNIRVKSLVQITDLIVDEDTQSIAQIKLIKERQGTSKKDVKGSFNKKVMGFKEEFVSCDWLLCCQHNDADADIFRAINGCGLVYDGRLVVDGRMQTTDPYILGAGSLCRFSRRFLHAKRQEFYNPVECGRLLATSLLRLIDPLDTSRDVDTEPRTNADGKRLVVSPPIFKMPVVQTCTAVCNKTYLEISMPSVTPSMTLKLCETTAKSITGSKRYTCLSFDEYGILQRLEYLGDDSLEVSNLQCLVGLPDGYLNSAIESHSQGYVTDWIAFFHEKWATALYHDRFHTFRTKLSALLKKDEGVRRIIDETTKFYHECPGDVKGATALAAQRVGRGGECLPDTTKRLIESQLVNFLGSNRELLSAFLLPKAPSSAK